jgi:precorrin-2/cobalt-factor-2 C20-methyltransferase
MSTEPVLYGVGVGPGDSDLLTVRAVNILRSVPVLVCPRGSMFSGSVAFQIAKPHLADLPEQKRQFFTFPMSKDPLEIAPAVDKAVDAICASLAEAKSVAFIAEGDPSTFSSFIYVKKGVLARRPAQRVETIPGVSSIMAVPAVAGVPLADGQERIAILPGTYGIDDLGEMLDRFDTVVLMKVGGELPHIVRTLAARNLLESAVYVSHATGPKQRIVRDLRTVQHERGDCFAMVVIRRNARSGLLLGDAEQKPLRALGLGP